MQFTAAPVAIPAGAYGLSSDGTTVVMLGTVDSTIPVCARGVGGCTSVAHNPVVHVGTPSGGFNTVQVDDIANYPLPSGYRQPNNGLTARAIAKGATGYVMVGNANVWDSDLFHDVASRSVLWFSPDAAAWQRIDLRDVVGDTNTFMRDVVATDSGFVAVGEMTGAADLSSPSTGLVLTSADGINWTKGPDLTLPWSVTLQRVVAHRNQVLLRGLEYVCTADSSAMNDFSLGGQDRLWASADGGATFTPIDLATTGVAADIPAPPTDPSQCGDFGSRSAYQWTLGFIDQADGTFVIGSKDGSTVSSSTDLSTWTSALLPGGTPTAGSTSSTPSRAQRIATSSADGLFVLSLEQLRDYSGTQMTFGLQVLGWESTDGGSTFAALPATRPLKDSQQGLVKQSDGTVALIATGHDPATGADGPALYVSSAGPLVAWGACTPAPAADCAFATLDPSASFTGADLTGIDLSGTSLAGVNFDGANLTDAKFAGAQLAGASFISAILSGATFKDADLTGANLAGATFVDDQGHSVSFSDGVVCPDGAPVDEATSGAAACRL
jgi:hypothetical protein